ncbi:hypothetical protein BGZ46_005311 [Entomortierella lignicola]|nr:hypothetical protein BGZ46_005311 [Entomortierella lignicola]
MSDLGAEGPPQILRPVFKNTNDISKEVPSVATVSINTRLDNKSEQYVVLLDDIKKVLKNPSRLRFQDTDVPFLMDENMNSLQPLRIFARPDVVLDVIIEPIESEAASQTMITKLLSTPPSVPLQNQGEQSPISIKATAINTPSPPHPTVPIYNTCTQPVVEVTLDRKELYKNHNHRLGLHYANSFTRDYDTAIQYFLKAASQGHIESQHTLGCMYCNGRGVSQDYSEALVWYQRAADQGNINSLCKLGYMYENGFGVDSDYSKALEFYWVAANQGDAEAQSHLGSMHHNGSGTPKDTSYAVEWWLKAATQGNEDALRKLETLG